MTVEERLEALEKELQQIKDVQAIKELKSKYFQALDTKNCLRQRLHFIRDITHRYGLRATQLLTENGIWKTD